MILDDKKQVYAILMFLNVRFTMPSVYKHFSTRLVGTRIALNVANSSCITKTVLSYLNVGIISDTDRNVVSFTKHWRFSCLRWEIFLPYCGCGLNKARSQFFALAVFSFDETMCLLPDHAPGSWTTTLLNKRTWLAESSRLICHISLTHSPWRLKNGFKCARFLPCETCE